MLLSVPNTYLNRASLWLIVSLGSISLTAQQLPIFTKYRDVLTIINPGAIPIDYFVYSYEPTVFLGATLREQWLKFGEGRPRTALLKADYIATDVGSGEGPGLVVGGYLMQNRIGVFETTGGYGKIAGVIEFPSGELSLGLTLGIVQRRLTDNPIGIGDNFSKVFPDAGVGIFYRKEFAKKNFKPQGILYTGISIPQVVGFDQEVTISGDIFSITQVQHYYFTFGFLHYLTEDSFVEPSIWVKYVRNVPISVDINIRAQLEEYFSIGAGFSTESNTLNITAGVFLKRETTIFKFGLGFSLPFADYGPQFGNSLEPHLNYIF